MEIRMYSMFDRISGVYYPPFISQNDNTAIRSFQYTLTKLTEQKPTDMELYFIGVFDQKSGFITVAGSNEFIYRGVEE